MISKFGRVKVETEFIDVGYKLVQQKRGDREIAIAVIEFTLKRPIQPGAEARDATKLVKAFVKELVPQHDVTTISGRGPIWFYGMLLHELAHVAKAVAVFDPKVGGAVVVTSHVYDLPKEGEVIELPEDVVKELTQ